MLNWRPMTLLNVDYKLAARAIAARLLKDIHLVVAEDQTCGVPGRYIGEDAAFLRDVVSYATMFGSPVVILSLDQEKAFNGWISLVCMPLFGKWGLALLF